MIKFCNLLRRLLTDGAGASMVEFTLAFPILASVSLGTVDLSYVLYQWNAASKATQLGARAAAVDDPVALGLNNLAEDYWSVEPYNKNIGKPCSDMNGNATANCPTFSVTCTNTSCSGGWAHSANAFNRMFVRMQAVFPRLQPQFVVVTYSSTGLGFAGRPGGLPVEVRVRIRCMRQELFFLEGLAGLVQQAPDVECAGIAGASSGWRIPDSTYTLITEDLCRHVTGGLPITCNEI
jgi:hypothetical protein